MSRAEKMEGKCPVLNLNSSAFKFNSGVTFARCLTCLDTFPSYLKWSHLKYYVFSHMWNLDLHACIHVYTNIEIYMHIFLSWLSHALVCLPMSWFPFL